MKTIIVATDFSYAASNAAYYAAEMALALRADLHLLHVYQVPVVYFEMPIALASDDINDDAEENILKLKEELSSKINKLLHITTEVREGNLFEELKTVCERTQPYVVVMGSQGKTAAERLLYGTHTIQVMKHLDWPVIAVPRDAQFTRIKRIGLTCDFENVHSTVPVEEIKVLVNDFNAELHVLNTGSRDEYNPKVIDQSASLQRMFGNIIPVYHFLTGKNTNEGIIHFAETNNIDLLIVLPKHHALIDKLVHSSHTKQLALHSQVPVIAFHNHVTHSQNKAGKV